jgi:hypothetical protein
VVGSFEDLNTFLGSINIGKFLCGFSTKNHLHGISLISSLLTSMQRRRLCYEKFVSTIKAEQCKGAVTSRKER